MCSWDREVHTCVKSYPVTDRHLEDFTAIQLTSSQPGIRGLSSHQITNKEDNDRASSVKKEIKNNGNPASIVNDLAADGEDPAPDTKDNDSASHVHTSSSPTPSNKSKAVDGEDTKLDASGTMDDPNSTDKNSKSSTPGSEPDTPLLVFTQHAELLMMKPDGKFSILVQVSTINPLHKLGNVKICIVFYFIELLVLGRYRMFVIQLNIILLHERF